MYDRDMTGDEPKLPHAESDLSHLCREAFWWRVRTNGQRRRQNDRGRCRASAQLSFRDLVNHQFFLLSTTKVSWSLASPTRSPWDRANSPAVVKRLWKRLRRYWLWPA